MKGEKGISEREKWG